MPVLQVVEKLAVGFVQVGLVQFDDNELLVTVQVLSVVPVRVITTLEPFAKGPICVVPTPAIVLVLVFKLLDTV